MRFREAVAFAFAMDWPLNIGITITWTALIQAGSTTKAIASGAVNGIEKNTPATSWRVCVALRDCPLSPFGGGT